jgi:hypothetical protein
MGIYLGCIQQGMHTQFWCGNLLEETQLEDQERDWRITLGLRGLEGRGFGLGSGVGGVEPSVSVTTLSSYVLRVGQASRDIQRVVAFSTRQNGALC